MSHNSKKPGIFNVKKDKRLHAKKRKLEALVNLVSKDSPSDPKQKSGHTYEESYKVLKDELKKYQKKKASEPLFYLTDYGRSACVKFLSEDNFKSESPLFFEDVYHLLLRSVLGHLSPFSFQWSKLEVPQRISKTVLIEIENLPQQSIFEMHSALCLDSGIFKFTLEVISPDIPLATELCTLHLASNFYSQAKKNYCSLFPMDNDTALTSVTLNRQRTPSKLHLLLSPIQLAMEHYPLPQNIFEASQSENYVFTKESYTPVTVDSPMFALDCEMCQTVAGRQEVTRIAVVNESLETVYHTFVKPKEEIIDYKTRFSGITPKMLKNVQTSLDDVHKELSRILPSDAILCGQSLNCDLHALKVIHPYVIDTSVIFNQCGSRKKKTSLKNLAKIHLKETIQDGKTGHNPIEDSIASMRLVQLKLKNFLEYGDAVLYPGISDNSEDNDNAATSQQSPKFSDFVKLNENSQHDGFFSRISKFSKKVCLIGNENALNNYCSEMIPDHVTKVTKSNTKKAIKAILNNLESNDCIISHLKLDPEDGSIAELSDMIKQAYDGFSSRTLFIVLMSSIEKPRDENFKQRFCNIVLKK